jgi:hypothetical protein
MLEGLDPSITACLQRLVDGVTEAISWHTLKMAGREEPLQTEIAPTGE